jgi:hypothetical protein
MAWRGQGGKRAKGRRGGQDPELDNSAWLAELEREAAQAGDDEDDWASTLRGRRASGPSPPTPPPQVPPTSEPSWAPPPEPPPPSGHSLFDADPGATGASPWSTDPPPRDPAPAPDPDWSSWRPPSPDPFEPPRSDDWAGSRGSDHGEGWQSAGVDTPTGAWSPVEPDYPAPPAREPDYPAPAGREPEYPDRPVDGEPDYPAPAAREADYPPPVGREPDYPALFGELYRRRTSGQDPIWEAPPAAEPPPDQGQPDPTSGSWPFEETTGSWEPSDRSFIWPSEELASTQAEWDQPAPQSWLDDPASPPSSAPPPAGPSGHLPTPSRPDPAGPAPDETAAWPAPSPEAAPDETAAWPAPSPHAWADPEPPPRPSPWASQPGAGNGAGPLGPPPAGPPPADWAAAIPTDVPAARRAADPGAATRVWRPDEAVEAEPGVPLGAGTAPGGEPTARAGGPGLGGPAPARSGSRVARPAPVPADEPEQVRRKTPPEGRRKRPAGERRARAWPRIVAIVSWIVLVMVVCWFYVFPWLERVLPENF